jgi:hypothetical protein
MENSKTSYRIVMFMLVIYIIASVQFLARETKTLMNLSGMSYAEKLNYLDKQYYRNVFYKYYVWIDDLLPKDLSFSIYYNKKAKLTPYVKYAHKFNYYLYPRHILYAGTEEDIAQPPTHWPRYKFIRYSDAIFILNTEKVDFKMKDGIKYVVLNKQKYYCFAKIDNKGLLLERSFIINTALKKKGWNNAIRAFKELYGKDPDKVAF